MNRAGSSKLGFYMQRKLTAILQLVEEVKYWKKRAIKAEQRAELLNELYLAASSNETLFIQLLQQNVKNNKSTATPKTHN